MEDFDNLFSILLLKSLFCIRTEWFFRFGVCQLVGNSDSIIQSMSVVLCCLLAPRCYCCVRE